MDRRVCGRRCQAYATVCEVSSTVRPTESHGLHRLDWRTSLGRHVLHEHRVVGRLRHPRRLDLPVGTPGCLVDDVLNARGDGAVNCARSSTHRNLSVYRPLPRTLEVSRGSSRTEAAEPPAPLPAPPPAAFNSRSIRARFRAALRGRDGDFDLVKHGLRQLGIPPAWFSSSGLRRGK